MKFNYSLTNPAHLELEKLPRVSLILQRGGQSVEVLGLVDSGATINILPHQVGLSLGARWNDAEATLPLAGNLAAQKAIPLAVFARLGGFAPVYLVFAWTKSENIPVLLGQTNFFMEFDVCFYRSQNEFEVKPIAANA